jgi:hypothetical protein
MDMGMEVLTTVMVTEEHQALYEEKRLALLVPDPWNDTFARKVGLTNMYIESTLAELMRLRAESDPGVKLNCPNPLYMFVPLENDVPPTSKDFDPARAAYHELLVQCFKDPKKDKLNKRCTKERFDLLKHFIEEKILERPLSIVQWEDYVPDIRLLDTIDEAMSWLLQYLSDAENVS